MLAGTCNAFSDGWGSSAPRRLSHLAVLRWVLVGQSKVLPCSLGAAGAFQPLQPLHSEEHTWASPRIAILEPCPSNKPPLAEHLWGKISPPGFAQMGKPRHGQVAEVAFGPDGEAAAQGSCTPAQTSTNECSNTFPDLCGPPAKPLEEVWGFCLATERQTDSTSNTLPPPAPASPAPTSRPTGMPGVCLCPEERAQACSSLSCQTPSR